MSIDDYYIVSYCWILYVIISYVIGSYSIIDYSKLLVIGYYWLFEVILP